MVFNIALAPTLFLEFFPPTVSTSLCSSKAAGDSDKASRLSTVSNDSAYGLSAAAGRQGSIKGISAKKSAGKDKVCYFRWLLFFKFFFTSVLNDREQGQTTGFLNKLPHPSKLSRGFSLFRSGRWNVPGQQIVWDPREERWDREDGDGGGWLWRQGELEGQAAANPIRARTAKGEKRRLQGLRTSHCWQSHRLSGPILAPINGVTQAGLQAARLGLNVKGRPSHSVAATSRLQM